jgi:NADPH-dependent 2,4-dienoyl-CoA reductase/sulfur reductase-like enzyme/rhodanese-related sulfurtransferase
MERVMAAKKILVIGGVAAGTKAAAKCRRELPDADIKIITDEAYVSYAGCGLPYYIGGHVKREQLEVRTAADFKAENDIEVFTLHRALSIDAVKKTVLVKDLRLGGTEEFSYDVLIVATGAAPLMPLIPGHDLKNVFTLRTIDDVTRLGALAVSGKAKKAIIVGGGYIGLEVAENLVERGIKVTLVEVLPHILPRMDEEMALLVQNHVRQKGVHLVLGQKVVKIEGDKSGEVARGITDKGEKIAADFVLWAAGVRPEVELARTAGIEIGKTGAIKTDERMRTSAPHVYAVGDCAETKNLITGKPAWVPLGSTANKMGRVAAINACGGSDTFPGVLGSMVIKVFDLNVAMTGLTQKEAETERYDLETVVVPCKDKAHYYPGNEFVTTKLVVDRKTRRILGAQIVGRGVVDKPIDILVTAITLNATVDQVAKMDFAYAPPYSGALSPLINAANVMLNKLDGTFRGITSLELKGMMQREEDVQLVDVRNQAQYAAGHVAGSSLLPVSAIRSRWDSLSKTRPTVCICNIGKGAYTGQLILRSLGFEDVTTLEGGVTAYPFELETGPKK